MELLGRRKRGRPERRVIDEVIRVGVTEGCKG